VRQFSKFKSIVDDLSKPQDPKTWGDMTDELFRLTKETALLARILDVLDELKTIRQVFLKQKEVLEKLRQLLSEDSYPDNLDIVNSNIGSADDMISRAERVHDDVSILLNIVKYRGALALTVGPRSLICLNLKKSKQMPGKLSSREQSHN
jgi:hypothetical protein